jgi:hypothetical protein
MGEPDRQTPPSRAPLDTTDASASTGATTASTVERTGVGATASAAVVAGVREPIVVCLLLAALFDELSGNPLHSIVLVGTAVALSIERARERAAVGRGAQPSGWGDPPPLLARVRSTIARSSIPLMLLPAAAFALVVGWLGRYSVMASLAVAVVGATAIALSWHGPLREEPVEPIEPVGVVLWALVIVALAGWELTNLFLQPSLTTDSWAHPTISVLTDPFLGSRIGRSVALIAWLRVGWGLLRR